MDLREYFRSFLFNNYSDDRDQKEFKKHILRTTHRPYWENKCLKRWLYCLSDSGKYIITKDKDKDNIQTCIFAISMRPKDNLERGCEMYYVDTHMYIKLEAALKLKGKSLVIAWTEQDRYVAGFLGDITTYEDLEERLYKDNDEPLIIMTYHFEGNRVLHIQYDLIDGSYSYAYYFLNENEKESLQVLPPRCIITLSWD